MPINAPAEYYALGDSYSREKDPEEKERILKEMIKILPKHKGSDKELAALKRRLSMLRKSRKRVPTVHKTVSIKKHWPRVSIVGYDPQTVLNTFNLARIDGLYHGIEIVDNMHVQIVFMKDVEKHAEVLKQSEVIITKNRIDGLNESAQEVSQKIDVKYALKNHGIIWVYTENSPNAIACTKGETVRDLADRLHFKLKREAYAIVYGYNIRFQGQRVSLGYALNDGDRISIKL
jgi:ribosome-interacting GTPase 1